MTIVVQCPFCETKFNLQPEMFGKTMRCPNLECRQVFPVKEQALPVEPPPLPPEPDEPEPARAGKGDAKGAAEEGGQAPASGSAQQAGGGRCRGRGCANRRGGGGRAPQGEGSGVVGRKRRSPPPKNGKSPPRKKASAAKPFTPIRRRKKRRNVGPILLIAMVVLIVLIGGSAALYIIRSADIAEQMASEKAEKEYKNNDYAASGKSYEALAKDYPDSENNSKYQFFARLCEMQVAVRNVTSKDNPEVAYNKFQEFTKSQDGSPFAKPTTGYGHDILEAGKQLAENVTSHVNDRINAYRGDRTKANAMARAEKFIAMGKALLLLLERYRSGDDAPLSKFRDGFMQAEADIKHEHDRSDAIAKARKQLEKISDAVIQQTIADLDAAGFLSDPEAQALIAEAKGKLQALVVFQNWPAPPTPPPPSAAASLLFVTPIGETVPPIPKAAVGKAVAESPPSVFLAVARGILYAIDEEKGNLLWAVRVGPEISDPPAIARLETDEGILEVALVTSNVNGVPALAGYHLRSGQLLWYQQLPAAAAGAAVVAGTRAYLAVRDELGSLLEFNLLPVQGEPRGFRKGRIRLGQPVGPGLVVRPGTGLIYAVADARRIFVIDVSILDDNGNLKPAQCVQVIATGHPGGAIRTPPVILGPEGTQEAERWMIISQSDGSNSMKLRAYPVMKIEPPAADAKPPAEVPATPTAELTLKGWAWYPPATDGERLAVVGDSGQFRLFEVRQPGTTDRGAFPVARAQAFRCETKRIDRWRSRPRHGLPG